MGTCGSACASYTLPSKYAGGSIWLRTPSKPDASDAANARYGLTSAPGMRHSMRNDLPEPTTRKPAVRLSYDHTRRVGAQDDDTKRLYEFTVGA